jgi:diguanylate cyclase (GGDEF)-like protein
VSVIAALIYWVIVALWLTVLGTIVVFYLRNPHTFGTTRLLLGVLAIDTFRNVFENVYFGLYFGSVYGFLSSHLASAMGHPVLLIVPKLLNVLAGSVVLALLLWRWLPLSVNERNSAERRAFDLETLATTDFLTGICNRRQFETLANAELVRCQRYMRPAALLMIDIDHFKRINDQFGHGTGDRVLQNVAALCHAEKRDSDVVARVGGEEFAILLPETNNLSANQFAERLCQRIRNSSVWVCGEKLNVTVSIGVVGAIGNPNLHLLMHHADQALYEAKRSGRDRVVTFPLSEQFEFAVAAE